MSVMLAPWAPQASFCQKLTMLRRHLSLLPLLIPVHNPGWSFRLFPFLEKTPEESDSSHTLHENRPDSHFLGGINDHFSPRFTPRVGNIPVIVPASYPLYYLGSEIFLPER